MATWPGPGFGFPLRFRVELSDEATAAPTFAEARVVYATKEADFANPGDRPLVIQVAPKPARHVRVTATKLWQRTRDFAFALVKMK